MSNVKVDETGFMYGRLVVLGLSYIHHKYGAYWLCLCSCGQKKVILGARLRNGQSRSCGCLRKDTNAGRLRKYSKEESTWRKLYGYHCGTRNEHGCLAYDFWKLLIQRPCYYCGSIPTQKLSKSGDPVLAHGVDRIDSQLGYSESNVVACCTDCNRAKLDMSQDDFLSLCNRIAQLHPRIVGE